MLDLMSNCIIRNEVRFCELDAHAGDGDFGMSLAKRVQEVEVRVEGDSGKVRQTLAVSWMHAQW